MNVTARKSAEQRRHDTRFPFQIPVELVHDGERLDVFTSNLGFRGMYLPGRRLQGASTERLPVNVILPSERVALTLQGTAVHGRGPEPGLGLRLFGSTRADCQIWIDLVQRFYRRYCEELSPYDSYEIIEMNPAPPKAADLVTPHAPRPWIPTMTALGYPGR